MKKTFDRTRPFSWSAISSFEFSKEQWYRRYVLGEQSDPSPELAFGSYVDKRIQNDPKFLPQVVRYPIMQHEMRCVFNKIPLVGYADQFHPKIPAIRDFKTGRHKWDAKRAKETGQLTMYALMLWLTQKIRPEDVEFYIDWLPTHYEENKIVPVKPIEIKVFKTRRTMKDVPEFGERINRVYQEMIDYCEQKPEQKTLTSKTYDKRTAPRALQNKA